MSRKISLSDKAKPKQKKEPFYLFVKNQGEGAARVAVIVLKIFSLILTSLFALCLGLLAPIVIWTGGADFVDPDIPSNIAIVMWFISSIIYIIGTFVLMFGHSRVATAIHAGAAVCTMITYYNFMMLFSDIPDNNGPSVLYLPTIFIFIISIIIMLLINIPKWLDKRASRDEAVAEHIIQEDEEE